MTVKQIMRIHTAAGTEDIDADRLLIENDEYILFRGDDEVRRVPISDVISEIDSETGEETGDIETVYSRS